MKKRIASAIFQLLTVATTTRILSAQTPGEGQSTAEAMLKKIDELTEQTRQLERQNQELMNQITALRESVQTLAKLALQAPAQAPPADPSSDAQALSKPNTASSGKSHPDDDDKALLPKASDGKPGVFGEFNPGRGFTVASSDLGLLNLSGYMAVRYLNQLPPDQTARDHLGRPIAVEPRNDFQFHRVMLFSQGWLFSPKFEYGTFVWIGMSTS
jgi:hypothetical protein